MNAKHTPGPWTARINDWSRWDILYAKGILASVSKSDDPASPTPVSEIEANARLIAAAPELLAALELLLAFHEPDSLSDQNHDTRLRVEADNAWLSARAALAKAKETS